MDTNNDYLFALQLQNELIDLTEIEDDHSKDLSKSTARSTDNFVVDLTKFETDSKKHKRNSGINEISQQIKRQRCQDVLTESVVDHTWETLDPNPDIHGLFLAFNRQYFSGTLDAVVVQWSKRMTVCAGLCRYQWGSCSISLSEPLLKLRPRKDLVETLLHEMIHAYLFLTNNKDHKDRDGHGPEFCKLMYKINMEAGTKISIYHNFHEEVRLYRQHWWKCNGPCQYYKPFYGYVKKSINRAPGPVDRWWSNHQAVCNGTFIKIKEPEGYGVKKKRVTLPVPKQPAESINKITNYISISDSPTKQVHEESTKNSSTPAGNDHQKLLQDVYLGNEDETTLCPVCNDTVLTEWLNDHLQNCSQLIEMFGNETEDKCKCPACNVAVDRLLMNEHLDVCKMLSKVFENDLVCVPDDFNYVNCPNCDKIVNENNINEHLDICISVEPTKPNLISSEIKCPCCENRFKNVKELDDHIDNCLNGC